MAPYPIRVFGDPVLKRPTAEVTELNGALSSLVDAMVATMYDAPGVGLAAPQVGVQQRLFVYDVGEGPHALVNPQIVETEGEWTYEEGCLSLPGIAFSITRPRLVTVHALALDGSEVVVQGDELVGRVFLHEIDHLDGVLMLERLEPSDRKRAMKVLRERAQYGATAEPRGRHAL